MRIFVSSIVVSLPSSKRLTYFWNFGSMLGMVYVFQLITGLLLALHYKAVSVVAFNRVQYIIYEVANGWLIRITHFNGASFFFIILFLHIFKGLYYFSYRLTIVWVSGVTILLLIMLVAFIGYVLPWAQIRFWAAMVITSLIRVVPYISKVLLVWVWGGFRVGNATLGLFFVLHFTIPLFLYVFILFHLVALHTTGSTSPLYCVGDYDKVSFSPYFVVKDGINLIIWVGFIFWCIVFPFTLGDREIFVEANRLVRPVHIVPEWYFLFAYAILRAIPNKLIGVLALVCSVIMLYTLVLAYTYITPLGGFNKYVVTYFLFVCSVLTFLGQCGVEAPYIILSAIFTVIYFVFIALIVLLGWLNCLPSV